MPTEELSTYNAVLLDLVIAVSFLVLSKFGMLYLMSWMTRMLSETRPTQKVEITPSRDKPSVVFQTLWYGLAVVWVINGIFQLRPTLVLMSAQHFIQLHPLTGQPLILANVNRQFVHLFFAHPITANLTLGFSQLLIGLLLLWRFNKRTGTIIAVLGIAFCVFIFTVDNGLYDLSTNTAFSTGAPGPSLLMAFGMGLLLNRHGFTREAGLPKRTQRYVQMFWVILFIWQIILTLIGIVLPHPASHISKLGYLGRILSVFIPLLVLAYHRTSKRIHVVAGLILCVLLALVWHLSQNNGLTPDFAFELNSAPVVFVVILATLWGPRDRQVTSQTSFTN